MSLVSEIITYEETCKNGQGFVTYTWEFDLNKPSIWIEGYEYKFNKKLLKSEYHKAKEPSPFDQN